MGDRSSTCRNGASSALKSAARPVTSSAFSAYPLVPRIAMRRPSWCARTSAPRPGSPGIESVTGRARRGTVRFPQSLELLLQFVFCWPRSNSPMSASTRQDTVVRTLEHRSGCPRHSRPYLLRAVGRGAAQVCRGLVWRCLLAACSWRLRSATSTSRARILFDSGQAHAFVGHVGYPLHERDLRSAVAAMTGIGSGGLHDLFQIDPSQEGGLDASISVTWPTV